MSDERLTPLTAFGADVRTVELGADQAGRALGGGDPDDARRVVAEALPAALRIPEAHPARRRFFEVAFRAFGGTQFASAESMTDLDRFAHHLRELRASAHGEATNVRQRTLAKLAAGTVMLSTRTPETGSGERERGRPGSR